MKWIQKSQYQPDGAARPSPRGFTLIERLGVIAIIALLAARCGVPALHAADTTFTKITTGAIVTDEGMFAGCAWGDYNNDGFLDLFVTNGGPQGDVTRSNFLYRNDGNTNQWIKLKLVGTASNRAAIGAKVRVKATIGGNTVWQLREISGGSGWGAKVVSSRISASAMPRTSTPSASSGRPASCRRCTTWRRNSS